MLKTQTLNKNASSYPRVCSPVGEADAEMNGKIAMLAQQRTEHRADAQSMLLGSWGDSAGPPRNHPAVSGLRMWKIIAH